MSEVKWFEVVADILNDYRMVLIGDLFGNYTHIVLWLRMLCLAGKWGDNGKLMLNNKIVYTPKMLSTISGIKESEVSKILDAFEYLGMINKVDDIITICDWDKYKLFSKQV